MKSQPPSIFLVYAFIAATFAASHYKETFLTIVLSACTLALLTLRMAYTIREMRADKANG